MDQGQGILFLQMVGVGVGVAVFFDSLRALRRVFKHPNFWVQVEDLLFWAVTTLSILYVVLNHAGGALRFFYLLGMVLGGVGYFMTASPWVMGLFVWLLRWKVRVCYWLMRVLVWLVSPVVSLLQHTGRLLKRRWLRLLKKSTQRVKKSYDKGRTYGILKWTDYQTKQTQQRLHKEQQQLAYQRAQAYQARQAYLEERLRRARERDRR